MMLRCVVIFLGISALRLPFYPVSPCTPPKEVQTVHEHIDCPSDSEWETSYKPGGRHNGLQCLLEHVAKSRSAEEAEHVNLIEHIGYELPCDPSTANLRYLYSIQEIAHKRRIHFMSLAPRSRYSIKKQLKRKTSHWTKNGKVVDDECYGDKPCRVDMAEHYLHFNFVKPEDEGLYACIHIAECEFADTVEGDCLVKFGRMYNIHVTPNPEGSPSIFALFGNARDLLGHVTLTSENR